MFGVAVSTEVRRTSLSDLADEPFISLTTFRRDGTTASTPVWVVGADGRLLILSDADTWKVKRIRRDSRVRVAPCGVTGKVRGDALEGRATIVADPSRVQALEARKYGFVYRLARLIKGISHRLRRQPAPQEVTIEISPPVSADPARGR